MTACTNNGAKRVKEQKDVWNAISKGRVAGVPLIVVLNDRQVGAALADEYIKEMRGAKCIYKEPANTISSAIRVVTRK